MQDLFSDILFAENDPGQIDPAHPDPNQKRLPLRSQIGYPGDHETLLYTTSSSSETEEEASVGETEADSRTHVVEDASQRGLYPREIGDRSGFGSVM